MDVYSWGQGNKGQLGHGDKKDKKFPTLVFEMIGKQPSLVAAGEDFVICVTQAGEFYSWGNGESGGMGRGDWSCPMVPTLSPLLRSCGTVKAISCGTSHTALLTADSRVFTFGNNNFGQLGHGNFTSYTLPKLIESIQGLKFKTVVCGPAQTALITDEGMLLTWGQNTYATLGHDSTENETNPRMVLSLKSTPIHEISFGISHAMAISQDGKCLLWGLWIYDLGIMRSKIPADASSLFSHVPIKSGCCGLYHCAVISFEGHAMTWGANLHGQLGLDDKENRNKPWLIKALYGKKVLKIVCGALHTLVFCDDKELYWFGNLEKGKQSCTPLSIKELTGKTIECMAASNGFCVAIATSSNGQFPAAKLTPSIRTTERPLRIFIASWNCNSSFPVQLEPWLYSPDGVAPDIFAIGLQEMVPLNSASLVKNQANKVAASRTLENAWRFAIERAINNRGMYFHTKELRVFGMYIIVFVNSTIVPFVSSVASTSIATGVNIAKVGALPNKGGASIRMKIFDTTFCFITSHFAAGQSQTEKRNQDYKQTISNIKFNVNGKQLGIADHDYVFWFGDLNYRINLSRFDCAYHCSQSNYPALVQHDQLNLERTANRVFEGFDEAQISFLPTYKYDIGTNTYDTSPKKRVPAWCDRILWKGSPVYPLRYSSHNDYTESDHKPITAEFKAFARDSNSSLTDSMRPEFNQRPSINNAPQAPPPIEINISNTKTPPKKKLARSRSVGSREDILELMAKETSLPPTNFTELASKWKSAHSHPNILPTQELLSEQREFVHKKQPLSRSRSLEKNITKVYALESEKMMILQKESIQRKPPPVPSRTSKPPNLSTQSVSAPQMIFYKK